MEGRTTEPELAEQLSRILGDVRALARRLRTDPETALKLLSHRELVIMNTQLSRIHEALDLLYARGERRIGERHG